MAAGKSKKSYKVIGHATATGHQDVEVMVKAESVDAAIVEAIKKEPTLEKHKDVRVYSQSGWSRVR